jgi:hypothetical protein
LFQEVFLEMATQALERITAEISRSSEYFSATELQAQTGQEKENFASVIAKESADNATDECEAAGVVPELGIDWARDEGIITLSISDNGRGMTPDLIKSILDFNIRVSNKAIYRSPTRGAQGNAFKTILGIPHSLGGIAPVIIEARGVKHIIRASADPLGDVRIDHQQEESQVVQGTRVTVQIPGRDQKFQPEDWARGFAMFNPHILVRIRQFEQNGADGWQGNFPDSAFLKSEETYQPSVKFPGEWRKFLPTDLTSPHWYNTDSLERLIYAHLQSGENKTLREFVKTFRGLSPNAKAKSVCDRFPGISRLSNVQENPGVVAELLATMKATAQPPKPETLGVAGEEHFRQLLDRLYGVKRHWYKRLSLELDGIPYLVEVMVAETEKPGALYHGLNFSPSFGDPIFIDDAKDKPIPAPKFSGGYSLSGYLKNANCMPCEGDYYYGAHTAVVFHMVSPGIEFLDRGKTRLKLPSAVKEMIGSALWLPCKTIYEEGERREKDAARQEKRDRERERERSREPNSRKDIVFYVLPEALAKATGGGQYPVSARSLYYQVRPLIQKYTHKELNYNYFSQDLLVQYQQEHGVIKGLYYDPRGVLYEPHTNQVVPLGTREVEEYDFPEWTFDKILFVEKKGLWPVLQAARLAERYDMAVIASEGFATEAARIIFKRANKDGNYQLFVLHDADPSGYNIARTLRDETRRMPGYHVDVTDIGLNLEDALAMDFECEEFTRQNALPKMLELNDLELEYFQGRRVSDEAWICKRVELNAMSAPQLIEYIEAKLVEAGATAKVLPPEDVVRTEATEKHRGTLIGLAEQEIMSRLGVPRMVQRVLDVVGKPDFSRLRNDLSEKLASNPPENWRKMAETEATDVVQKALKKLKWEEIIG